MNKQTFFIPGKLPGMNEIIKAAKLIHPYVKMKKDLTSKVVLMIREKGIKPYTTPVSIVLQWAEPNMKRDPDNIAAGAKFVLDGMVKAGTIKSDGFKHVGSITSFFYVEKSAPGVMVRLNG